jgi:hypothetical protein
MGAIRARFDRRARGWGLALAALSALWITGCRCGGEGPAPADLGTSSDTTTPATSPSDGEGTSASPEATTAQPEITNPSVLVVAHTYRGRTATAGRAVADLLGGRFVSFVMGPDEQADSNPEAIAAMLEAIAAPSVETVFLAFPVWSGAPSPPIQQLAESASWAGKRVVPLYTFATHVETESLRGFILALRNGGADVPSPLALQLPLSADADDIRELVETRLTSRQDLWWNQEAEVAPNCDRADPRRMDATLCHIPEGWAWVNTPLRGPEGDARRSLRLERVPPFSIDLAEVHVDGYQACVDAGACPTLDVEGSFCNQLMTEGYFPAPCAGPRHAEAFCTWVGMRVPTLAEWTRAARGDTSRSYPWGGRFRFSGDLGNFGETEATGFPRWATVAAQSGFEPDRAPGLAAGCTYPQGRSPWGPCDMAGNLSEIVRLDDERYAAVGGNWTDWDPTSVRVDHASEYNDVGGTEMTGFRCVR